MIVHLPALGIAFAIGMSLGWFYFGGLWLTVRRLPSTQHPFRLLLGSFCLRLSFSLIVFYLIVRDAQLQSLASLLSCILGFFLVRGIFIRRLATHRRK